MNSKNEVIVIDGYNNSRGFGDKVKDFFAKLCRNNIRVSGKKEYFSLPVLLFIIIGLVLIELALPAIIISLFCGIEYTLCGEDYAEEKKFSFNPDSK